MSEKLFEVTDTDLVLRVPIAAIVAEAEDNGVRVLDKPGLARAIGVELFLCEDMAERTHIRRPIAEAIDRLVGSAHPSIEIIE